jgi:ketosteroid isomerase-like protein
MRNSLLILSVLIQVIAYGQPFTPQQQEVINAENSFAGLSKSANQVEAFMAYLSDSTIMFKGTEPVLGKTLYKDRKPDSSLLFWWPVFVGVSADGKMAFSTGPWEWSKRRDTLPEALGYYATLWQKDNEGQWKMRVDLGIGFPASEKSNPPLKASPTATQQGKLQEVNKMQLMQMDSTYCNLILLGRSSYVRDYFATDGHILRSGHKPFVSPNEFSQLVNERTFKSFSQQGGGISEAKDMFYVYGYARSSYADERAHPSKYFRVWKKENNNWKIVLDVISEL